MPVSPGKVSYFSLRVWPLCPLGKRKVTKRKAARLFGLRRERSELGLNDTHKRF